MLQIPLLRQTFFFELDASSRDYSCYLDAFYNCLKETCPSQQLGLEH